MYDTKRDPQATCHIVCAGEDTGCAILRQPGDWVIAVDGGLRYLQAAGVTADCIIGDFDSLNEIPQGKEVLQYKCEKDETDTYLAALKGLECGYQRFVFYCATGGRLDHTLANLQTLLFLTRQGKFACIRGDKQEIRCLKNGRMDFAPVQSGLFSVFSVQGKATGVTIQGLRYTMQEGELSDAFPMGISNEWIGKPAFVEVKQGELFIIFDRGETV